MQKAEDSSDDSSQGDESEDDSVATFAKPNPTRKTGPKAWVVLFTCATTRAIHLEFVTEIKTESFLGAFRRFIARWGPCTEIFSHNGTQITAASRILHLLRADTVAMDFIANAGISWRFSANLAPWWGGFWERMVRTMKEHFRKTVGFRRLALEQLMTVLVEMEQVINERPLFYVDSEVNSANILAPSQLLLGRRPQASEGEIAHTPQESQRGIAEPTRLAEDAEPSNTKVRADILKWDAERHEALEEWWNDWQ